MNIGNPINEHQNGALALIIMVILAAAGTIRHFANKERGEKSKWKPSFPTDARLSGPPYQGTETVAVTEDPITRVAKKMELSPAEVRVVLGLAPIPSHRAKTADEARDAYGIAEQDSDEEYAALIRWIELENDLENMQDLWDKIDSYPTLMAMLTEKWIPLSLQQIKDVQSEDEFDAAYDAAPVENVPELVKALHNLYSK